MTLTKYESDYANDSIVVFGAGKGIEKILRIWWQFGEWKIAEIWDNNARENQTLAYENVVFNVVKPHRLERSLEIVISSDIYYDDIKHQLIDEFQIQVNRIHHWNYCLNSIKQKIISKYHDSTDSYIQRIVGYLYANDLSVFNNGIRNESFYDNFAVSRDNDTGLLYSSWNGKKIYLKRDINNARKAKSYLSGLLVEQINGSPHRYLQRGFEIEQGDVIIDCGAAEGIFTLDAVDKAEKIYCVECDKDWIEALKLTLKPYGDKCIIIEKMIGGQNTVDTITIDEIFRRADKSPTFIKMDIEGCEADVISSSEYIENCQNIRIEACTYHRSQDGDLLKNTLRTKGFTTKFSSGYMFFPYLGDIVPELRHGLILADKRKTKILLWGAGTYLKDIIDDIEDNRNDIIGVIDHDGNKKNYLEKNGYTFYFPFQLKDLNYHIIVITAKSKEQYQSIFRECLKEGVGEDKIIWYWDTNGEGSVFRNRVERLLEIKKYKCRAENAPFELGVISTPKIHSSEEVLNRLINEHLSLCRFGDGEFEIIRGNERAWFQQDDDDLAKRLKSVLRTKNDKIIVGIADNFGSLSKYTDQAADAIRFYVSGDTREDIMHMLDSTTWYGNAYVTRPYMIYEDKRHAERIFHLYKKLWQDRSVCVVEGAKGRFGLGNDLLDNTNNIKRISCPATNAYGRYDEIYDAATKLDKDTLFLVSLGPAATVLAYDLTMAGYQAIDIGQLDNEYDWYKMRVTSRVPIPGKMVAECRNECSEKINLYDKKWKSQIIKSI